jgi:preprotein translocase SecE subunit
MARTAARPVNQKTDDQEEDLIEEGEWQEGAEKGDKPAPTAVISDSRRRRMLKRGETLPEPVEVKDGGKGRPTPSHREGEPERKGNVITNTIQDLRDYFVDTVAELQKVAWPTREETLRLTYIVLAATAITAIILGIISFVFSLVTQQVANPSTATLFGFLTIAMIVAVAVIWLFRERLPGGRIDV